MVHRQVQLPVRRKGRLLSSMNMNVLASLPVPFAVSADVDLNLSISQPTEQSPKRDKSSLGLQLHHGSYEGSELKRPKEEYQQRQQRRREEVEVAIGSRGSSGGGRLRWSCELRRWAAAVVACNQN